jgi:hypothetical protein
MQTSVPSAELNADGSQYAHEPVDASTAHTHAAAVPTTVTLPGGKNITFDTSSPLYQSLPPLQSIDGNQNIWIVKPARQARGVGMLTRCIFENFVRCTRLCDVLRGSDFEFFRNRTV